MRRFWVLALAIAGAALLVAALFLARWSFDAKNDARREAGRRLDATRDAARAVVHDLLVETGAKIDEVVKTAPGFPAPAPAPLKGQIALDALDEFHASDTIPAPELDLWFHFSARPPSVHVWRKAADAYATGRVPLEELKRRLGAEAIEATSVDRPPVRLSILDDEGATLHPRAEAPVDRKAQRRHGARVTDAVLRIRAGKPSVASDEGLPEVYSDAEGKQALGSWDAVPGTGAHLWVLAEERDDDVVAGAAGVPVAMFGRASFELMWWHGALAAGLLCLIASAFLWLPARGGAQIAVLARTYSFAKPYRWGIAASVAVGAIYGLAGAYRAIIAKSLFDDVLVDPGPDAQTAILNIVWMTLGLGVVISVTNFLKEYLTNYYATAMMADVRMAIARKIVGLPLAFFNRMRSGDLVARIERDVSGMRQVLMQVFEKALVAPFILVGAIVIAFMMDWRLALVLFGLPILVWPVFRIAKRIKKRATKRQNLAAEISHVLFQMLTGIKVVKAFHGEEREAARMDNANRRFIHEARRIARLMAFSDSLLDFLQMVGGAIVVWAGGYFALRGQVRIGDLAGFVVVILSVYAAAKDITSVLNKMIESLPSIERVYEIFDTPNELVDGPRTAPSGPLVTGIELRGVRFRYLENEILRGVDLLIPAGKVVALVGPTGAGKTTLCDLVARFYDPTEGSVLWDGVDAREYSVKSLCAKLAIVTQEAFLFNASIDENIRYGREDATHDEVERAARDANVHDEILAMEGGYGKLAGERGASLSGGQRQRVTIARALVKDAPVLILDEATSNLDTHSEKRVQAALARLMRGRTVLVVAHRLSTIRNADKVVVVDSGRIVEEGSPDELLAKEGGHFRQMYRLQSGDENGKTDAA